MKRFALSCSLLLLTSVVHAAPVWFESLDAAYAEAQKTSKPILALATPPVGAERWIGTVTTGAPLDRFVLLRLGDTRRDDLRALGVATAPAARLITPGGAVQARLDRLESAKQLTDWLTANPAAKAEASDDSAESLIKRLGHPEASVREAAMRKLQTLPQHAGAIVDALKSDTLATRVSATELLELWHAPTNQIDPWERSTLTPERLAALSAWATKFKDAPAAPTTAPVATVANEIDQLLAAPMAFEARAVRERLVRYGEPALGAVRDRLKLVRTDEARRRLTAARYRLAMSESLAAEGAALIDPVVEGDAASRHRAAVDLIGKVGAEDAPLLLELFSDDDAFVRETALRALRKISGAGASAALMKLLADPEPNVRAAVLKTLAEDEKGDESLADGLATYVAAETDADLVVHAVHVLKSTPGDKSVRTLMSLLAHKQWQVRAEALEALKTRISPRYREKPLPEELASEAFAAVLSRLEDEEPFVVSRALLAMEGRGIKSAMKPIFATIERKPDMAPQLLAMLDKDPETLVAALPNVKKLATHADPKVRAAAIRSIGKARDDDSPKLLPAALSDPDSAVREAGLGAIVASITTIRPDTERDHEFRSSNRPVVDINKWIVQFRAGKGRPEWLNDLPIDQKLLEPLSPAGRAQGAIVLAALGKDEIAIPILTELAGAAQTKLSVVPALGWLPEDQRISLYTALEKGATPEQSQVLLQALAKLPSPGAQAVSWEALGKRTAIDDGTEMLSNVLIAQYSAQNVHRFEPGGEKAWMQTLERVAVFARSGPEIRRAIALVVLKQLDPEVAAKEAGAILDDAQAPASLRLDALQIQLLALAGEPAQSAAVQRIGDERLRELSVRYLAGGDTAITGGVAGTRLFRDEFYSRYDFDLGGNAAQRVAIKPPVGLTVDPVRPYLKSDDKMLAAYAGYLMVLLDQKEGFEPLERAWNEADPNESPLTRLVYRAIAHTNDESKLPALEKIYQAYKDEQSFALPDFYWTIRVMKGDAILKFRKRIRDEVGMERLRAGGF